MPVSTFFTMRHSKLSGHSAINGALIWLAGAIVQPQVAGLSGSVVPLTMPQ